MRAGNFYKLCLRVGGGSGEGALANSFIKSRNSIRISQ